MANIIDVIINMMKKGTGDTEALTGVQKLGAGFKALTGFSLGAAGALGIAAIGIRKVADFTNESVNETVAYNKTMREMAQVTGIGSEEISRIVQVGDDWGISIDAIRTSLAFMNKTGVAPSIDNLAKLADEYVASTDKAAFAATAVKTLGRGYQTLIPLLALGGKGFRDAAAGIDRSLIATEDGIAASREYEVVMDSLQDTVTGLKYELANGLIPTLVDLLETVNKVTKRVTDEHAAWKLLKQMHEDGLITQGELVKGYLELSSGLEDLEDVTNEYNAELAELKERYEKAYPEEQKFVTAFKELSEATEEGTKHASSYGEQLHYVLESTSEAREGIILLAEANIELVDETDKATEATRRANTEAQLLKTEGIDILHSGIESLVNEAMADFQGSMTTTMAMEAIWLLATGQITQAQYDQRIALAETLTPLEAMIGLVDEHKLGMDYLKQSMEDGIVTEGELTAALIATGMSAKDAAAYVAGLKSNIDGLTDKTVTVTTRMVTEQYLVEKYGPVGYQHGANFIVPPGYPNDSYRMNVESGEHVIVVPKDQVTTTNNFNVSLTGSGNAGADVLSSVRLLELLYG